MYICPDNLCNILSSVVVDKSILMCISNYYTYMFDFTMQGYYVCIYIYVRIQKYIHLAMWLFCTVALNDYDLRSRCGSPWEVLLEDSYLIKRWLRYSGFFSFIPDLQLSSYVMMCVQAKLHIPTLGVWVFSHTCCSHIAL